MIDRELISMMTDTIVWTTSATLSAYGVPTWASTGYPMRARITYKHQQIRDHLGNVREARGTIWCVQDSTHTNGQSFAPSVDDRVVMPDTSTPPILMVETFADETGTHHHKVAFGY
jgi:hypothetical protein